MDKLLAQNVVARFKGAAIPPTVEGFRMFLFGAVTQYDERASKRPGYNRYALGHYAKAMGDIDKDVASFKGSSDPGDLQKLIKSINRRFLPDFPPAKKTVKAIEEFLRTGKPPMYPGVRVRKAEELWLSREDIAKLCPSCADKMASLGIRQVRASVLFQDEKLMAAALAAGVEGWRSREAADPWGSLPHGWTQESLKSMWDSLTGSAKHKVTACIKKLEGAKGIDDAGAFCASLADKLEPGWRSR